MFIFINQYIDFNKMIGRKFYLINYFETIELSKSRKLENEKINNKHSSKKTK